MIGRWTGLAWSLWLLGSTWAVSADRTSAPNVVFILADDLGVFDLACYGRREHHTPHLDRLASEGLRCTTAYCAQPICSPTRAALVTGKWPARLHLTTYLPGRADARSQRLLHPLIHQALPLAEVTIAERLRAAGYATACIGKWHLGEAGYGPAEQGFDVVYAGQAQTKPSASEGGKGEYDLTDQACAFLAAHRERPFFLYLAHNSPHIPLAAQPELVERYAGAFNPTYAAMIHTLDDCVGRVLAQLDELHLVERTLVVFTSDNGGLHVLESPESPATHNGPFRAGKGFVYEGGLRIPLIVRWPGQVPPGATCDVPVISTDWAPTLAAACGAELDEPLDGVNLLELLRGGELAPRPLFWHFPHYTNQGGRPAGAMREGHWKLVEQYEDGSYELYDLADDPGETRNLAQRHPERTGAMQARLAEWRAAVGAQENEPNPDFDAAAHQALYLDVDVSRLQPAATAAEMRTALKPWRQGMNEALRHRPEVSAARN